MKKYEEQIINYLVGGILGLLFLIPFMCIYANCLYKSITSTNLSYLSIGSLCMLSIFLLFTVATGVTSYKMKEKSISILPSLIVYFKTTPFISSFLFINILNGFNVPLLFSIIISLVIALVNYLLIKKIVW
jgi:hypothetical protein